MQRPFPVNTQSVPAEHLEYDLGTAAFLTIKGFRLLGLADTGRGRYAFRFEDSGAAAQAALGYMQGESVPAKALIADEKDLKTLEAISNPHATC